MAKKLNDAVKPVTEQPSLSKPVAAVLDVPEDLAVDRAAPVGDKITLPEDLVPKVVDQKSLPKQPYWLGTCANAPFHSTRLAGLAFPGKSFENIPGRGPSNHKMGCMLMLTEEQVKAVLKASALRGWRREVIKKRNKKGEMVVISDTYKPIEYDANNPPQAGDKLTANFVYIRKLKPGQRIPIGVENEFGDSFPTPPPLRE